MQLPQLRMLPVSLVAALLLLGGCDLFGSDEGGSFEVVGTVIDAETGASFAGISVTLRDPSVAFVHPIRVQTTTGADGRFRLAYSNEYLSGYSLSINDGPYDDRYTTNGDNFYPDDGDVLDYGEIPISRYRTTLVTGTVVLDETVEPIDSLRVEIEEYVPTYDAFWAAETAETAMTAADGTFTLRFRRALPDVTYRVRVNTPWRHDPPTPYTDRTFDVAAGDTLALGVVELSRVGG